MLAGRKLLLADDSVTIQKVIDLTFADEGVRVVAFSNGQEALDHIEEVAPDVVLADVFMPLKNGYDVCEYVKQNEKLKHIPVMLLVGSFEPFDEAEARRVGADDILTKPFQSIRRLIERVGALIGKPPAEKEMPTAELTKPQPATVAEEILSPRELEITTADTQRLRESEKAGHVGTTQEPAFVSESVVGEEQMETRSRELANEPQGETADALLDLGEFEPRHTAVADDFVLDLDLEDTLGGNVWEPAAPARTFVEPEVAETGPAGEFSYQPQIRENVNTFASTAEAEYDHEVRQIETTSGEAFTAEEPEPIRTQPSEVPAIHSAGEPAQQLAPEMIEAIARRAVELLSERVVRDVAWEVVPELAELLIKRRLEEQESQPK